MSAELIAYLSGFVRKRRLESFDRVLRYRTKYINIVCEDIYQGHNANAIIRTCDCIGIQDIHVIEARNTFEVNPDIALGASNWLTIERHSNSTEELSQLFSSLRSKGYRIVATTPHIKGVSLTEFDIERGPVSIVFGTEKRGLSEELMTMADEYLTIDMYGFTESLNVSVSAGIILHYLRNRLVESVIEWHLNDIEMEAIKLEWLRKSIRRSDLVEKDFWNKKSQDEDKLNDKNSII